MSNNEDRSLSNSSSENSKRSSCVSHKSTKLVSVKNHRNSETSVNGKENENSIIYSQKMLGKTNQSNLKGTDENSFGNFIYLNITMTTYTKFIWV